ncbi:hypothetical protein J1792_32295 [Streptomyces triculaminicus]|uniref:Uncharacterized protein n=1 Tax=Streptomyces triculaminicus TaxID=2816232 RepID=A0A939FTU6_9ACTN|nr:hypothetical protein [Streptomyces triculaminicus]MBO0657227.1 hypothetical protein [Streptomyces triculaminicus]
MSSDADREEPSRALSTWPMERLWAFALEAQGQELEAARVIAQAHADRCEEPQETRRQWAKLSLQVNQLLPSDTQWDRARLAQQNFILRMWVIDQLGPDDEDPDWNPERLAADTAAVFTLAPSDTRALAGHWRSLAIDQIGELDGGTRT